MKLTKRKQAETAVLTMSDIHYGKHTKTFNPDVCKRRLDRIGVKLGRIRELLGEYEINQLVVMLLGDANDGNDIFATQAHEQAITNVEQQAWELSDYLAGWLKNQKEIWPSIRVECVPGNHGRSKGSAEAANWDFVMYRYLKMKAKQYARVGYGEGEWLRKVAIRGHQYVLFHGHDVRSFSGIPFYGLLLRMTRWMSTKLAPFDLALVGHFHTSGTWRINNMRLVLSGTMVSDDDWAMRILGWESATEWSLFGVSNKRPITWQFPIELV